MKKIVRLTESDLTRIVRRVLRETQEKEMEEGWLSNLFGGKKEDSKNSGSYTNRSIGNTDCYEVHLCDGSHGGFQEKFAIRKEISSGDSYCFVNKIYRDKYRMAIDGHMCPTNHHFQGADWGGMTDMG